MTLLIILLSAVITVVFSLPIGVALGLTGLAIFHFVVGEATDLAINPVWNIFTDFTLTAVPLFILMGEILLVSGVSSRLYTAIEPLFARVPGKLLHTNIAVCAVFGSVSGASTSTAAAIGSVAYPEMVRRGYRPSTVVGTLAAGGTLGLLIPPSLALLIYGATQQVSIGRLFAAAIIPGIILAIMMMAYIFIRISFNPDDVPNEKISHRFAESLVRLLKIWPLGILVFMVLGTIYMGIATPTEAAGLGVVGAILLGFFWGDLTFDALWDAFVKGVLVFVAIGTVMLGAVILANSISILGIPYKILSWINSLNLSPTSVLVAVCVFYLVLGCFFDGISLMLMTLPVVFPVMTGLGYDPVWLGVIITILIEVGMLTPPVGMNLFVLSGISGGEVSLLQAAKASFPYWVVMLLGIVLFTLFPNIILTVPDYLFN